MSSVSKRKKEGSRGKIKTMGDHKEFLKRITKTLYYGQLPALPCLSLPVTEVACSVWSAAQRGRSLRRLRPDAAARAACVSPCALVLALLYVERLQRCNPDYLAAADPHQLFLVSLMVSNKFLQDDGEDDEVICSEWATSGGLQLHQLKKLELDFLNAIEWKVFVSARSFAAGLARLERRVALRQAHARGWFTYADLLAAAPALTAAAVASLAAAAALLASALLVAHLPAHPASHDRLAPASAPPAPNVASPADLPPSLRDLTPPTDLHPSLRDLTSLTLDLPPNLRIHPAHIHNSTPHVDASSCCRGWHWQVYEERHNRSRREPPPDTWWAAEWQHGELGAPLRWLQALAS